MTTRLNLHLTGEEEESRARSEIRKKREKGLERGDSEERVCQG